MKAVQEFDRFAASYGHYSVIQQQAAEYLISWIGARELGRVLDLGCGEGALWKELRSQGIVCEAFLGVDLADGMLERHPRTEACHCLRGDFNDPGFLASLGPSFHPDFLLSSSALQWSRDLSMTAGELSRLAPRAYFSLFTSGTFATLHRLAGIESPIRSFEETLVALRLHYRTLRLERVRYRLHFESKREIFRYIKRSGVSGGEARLGYRQLRKLMEEYPLDYLEFELLFAALESRISFSRS